MVLYVEYGADACLFGALGARQAVWSSAALVPGDMRPLAKALVKFGLARRRPEAVVAGLADRLAGAAHVPWSTVRAAVAAVNTLGLAWDVPVAAIKLAGTESRDDKVSLVRQAAAQARKGDWISALYSGEPNISKAKKVI